MKYEIIDGPLKGKILEKQTPYSMNGLLAKGIAREIKEEKRTIETKEEKFIPKTKRRVQRKRKN